MTLEEANAKTGISKYRAYMKLMGPAWLAVAMNIGGATVANAGSLASRTGFTYMWVLIPATFVICIVCIMVTRVTLKTGLGPISVARTYLGEWAAWVTGISVFIVNAVFHTIQYALVGNILKTLTGLPTQAGAIIGFVFVVFVVLNPATGDKKVQVIQMIMKWMVAILIASFVLILFIVPINWAGAFKGFIPTMKGTPEELVLLAGLLGAGIAINVPCIGAYGARQNKWNYDRKSLSVFELIYSNFWFFMVQVIIILSVGSVLHPQGVVIMGAGAMAETFRPFAGNFSVTLLSLGLIGAVLSTMAMQVLMCGYLITDLLKWEVDLNSTRFKSSEIIVTFIGLIGVLSGWNAFSVSTYGAGFNLTFFPIVSILMLIIGNKKEVMKEAKMTTGLNIAVCVGILLSLTATINYWANILK
ncbi:MAG: divalent metal cation transporter [Treponema sp.]|nr:divalent metal cation transporter [Treponema sp.]